MMKSLCVYTLIFYQSFHSLTRFILWVLTRRNATSYYRGNFAKVSGVLRSACAHIFRNVKTR